MTPANARLNAVFDRIAKACAAAHRRADTVRLLAVSKAQPAAALRELYGLGQRQFGENYAQEMAAKAEALGDLQDLEFVFIGGLQSNKINLIVQTASAIQSVGSERHARLVARAVQVVGKAPYPIHLLVNAGEEDSKGGLKLSEVEAVARVVASELPELQLMGVMAIPPPLPEDAPEDVAPELYLQLARLAATVGKGELSLGMSGDLGQAIAAGATCVRIGTALFGARIKIRARIKQD